ncbi:MAG TPA: M56 family metallopeptidase [Candidatus Agathobaculum merdigallinarum]|nr:M56 family metallopeptidase [Candidatus Agathobaculum merdigallinarum]
MLRFEWSELLNNLVQIGLTVSAAALVLFLLRKMMKKRYPTRAICFVWAILAIRLIIPVQITLPDPPVQVTPRTTYLTYTDFTPAQLTQAGLPVIEQDGETTTRRWATAEQAQALTPNDMPSLISFNLGYVLACIWGLGMAAFAGWQVFTYWKFAYLLRRSATPAERDTLRRVFEEQKQSLGIRREIPLIVTPAADCPMLAGFFKPALYLPDEALSEQEAMFIFRHELTHLRRGDLWLKLLLTAARAVHWFNPLVHLMARFAQEDIELACDDAVVRGMDGAARRAYGETILRSAAAQVKKRALVSCFTGDKETLMRRFEGLFDTRAKKRGVALVVAAAVLVGSLGCAVSVGESKDSGDTFETQALAAAEEYGQALLAKDGRRAAAVFTDRMIEEYGLGDQERANNRLDTNNHDPWVINDNFWPTVRYAVKFEPETDTCLMVLEIDTSSDSLQIEGFTMHGIPLRWAVRLSFEEVDGKVLIDSMEILHSEIDPVDSLETFRMLYENDLGLPDFLSAEIDWTAEAAELTDPGMAAVNLLHLGELQSYMISPLDPTEGSLGNDIWVGTFALADHSEIQITMINQFDQGWLPQDFTYEDGINNRTAADLAQQFARGVQHKSGQYVYPILSEELRADFITQQQGPSGDGDWHWKYGGSSPSFRSFAIVPTEDESTYTAVFQMHGGGATDYRSAVNITVGAENGRQVITAINRCDEHLSFMLDQMSEQDTGYTLSELFSLYYESELAWPVIPEGATSFNGAPLDELTVPLDAVEAVFGYFGDYVEQTEGNVHNIRLERWYTAELVSETDSEAVVRMNFTDGSPSVDVRMQKTGDYWMPAGLAAAYAAYDEAFSATALSAGENIQLPAGGSQMDAIDMAEMSGGIPQLQNGDVVTLQFGAQPAGNVTLTERDINPADGTPRYDEQLTAETTLPYSANGEYTYTIEPSWGEYLSSQYPDAFYRAVTADYTDESGTARTATFVFCTTNGDAQPDYTITSTTYHNDTYGYNLRLPECFVGRGYVKEYDDSISFGLANALPGYSDDPTDGGAVMSLNVGSTVVLEENNGADWEQTFPVPCKKLAELDGLTYYLTFASDVQYDPQDEAIAAAYTEMYQAAQAITPDAFSFEGQTDRQWERLQEKRLSDLGWHYGTQVLFESGSSGSVLVTPDAGDGSCTVVWSNPDGMQETRYAERVWFDDVQAEPTRVKSLGTSDAMTTAAQFSVFYRNDLGLPFYDAEQVAQLQFESGRIHSGLQTSGSDLSTPEAGAAFTILRNAAGQFEASEEIPDADEGTWWANFRFDDGTLLKLEMQPMQLDGSQGAVWLPIDWRILDASGEIIDGAGRQYSPYDAQVYATATDYYGYRDTDDLLWYLDMGWVDGAYAESVWAEIDRRWAEDPDAIEDAIANYSGWDGAAVRELWQQHKAANLGLFGQ